MADEWESKARAVCSECDLGGKVLAFGEMFDCKNCPRIAAALKAEFERGQLIGHARGVADVLKHQREQEAADV